MPSLSVFGVVADSLSFTFGATSAVVHYCDLQAGFAPLPSDLASATVTAVTPRHWLRCPRSHPRCAPLQPLRDHKVGEGIVIVGQRHILNPAAQPAHLVGRPLHASAPAVVVEPVRDVRAVVVAIHQLPDVDDFLQTELVGHLPEPLTHLLSPLCGLSRDPASSRTQLADQDEQPALSLGGQVHQQTLGRHSARRRPGVVGTAANLVPHRATVGAEAPMAGTKVATTRNALSMYPASAHMREMLFCARTPESIVEQCFTRLQEDRVDSTRRRNTLNVEVSDGQACGVDDDVDWAAGDALTGVPADSS